MVYIGGPLSFWRILLMSLSSVTLTALSGLSAAETMLGTAADNLANSATTGFKQSRVELATAGPLSSSGGPSVGSGVQVSGISADASQGTLLPSDGALNMAIEGDGYFLLEGPDGETWYTRDGSFHLNADRQLVSSTGERVLGWQPGSNLFADEYQPLFIVGGDTTNGSLSDAGQTVDAIQVTPNGRIYGHTETGKQVELGRVRLARFNNASGLYSEGASRFSATGSSGPAITGDAGSSGLGYVRFGALEASNVDVAENLVSLARASTMYGANLHVFSTADRLMESLLNMRR